jgi:PiT family inorganic phosphate transporter
VWVIASAGLAIGLGTYIGGWRIIRTMGKGLTDIQSPQGFAAEAASTTVILTSAHLGFALSTTQVCSGGILGAGLGRRLAEVRWGTAGRMVIAWLVTLPAAALVGGLSATVVKHGGNLGTALIALIAAAVALFIVIASRRNPVHADNVNETHEVTIRSEASTDVRTAA